jgi:hypothetical protein
MSKPLQKSITASSCKSCSGSSHDLIPLPFGQFICESCIDFKCQNEFRSRDDRSLAIDHVNPLGILLDRFDYTLRSTRLVNRPHANNIGMLLFNTRQRLLDLKRDMRSYHVKIRSHFDAVRYEIDSTHRIFTQEIHKAQRFYSSLIERFQLDVKLHFKQNKQHLTESISAFLDQHVAFLNNSLQHPDADLEAYATNLEKDLTKMILALTNYQLISHVQLSGAQLSLGKLNSVDFDEHPRRLQKQFTANSAPQSTNFSMSRILDLKKPATKHERVGFKAKSIQTLINTESGSDIYLFFYESVSSKQYKLRLYDENVRFVKQIEIDSKIHAIATDSKSSVVVCYEKSPGVSELGLLNSNLDLIWSKEISVFKDVSKYQPVDVFAQGNRVYLLFNCLKKSSLKVCVFNLDFNLMNSFDVCLDFSVCFKESVKLFVQNEFVFCKVNLPEKTRILVIDCISGDVIKTFDLDFKFDVFFVLKKSTCSKLEDLSFVFFCNERFYVCDLINEKCVFSTGFQSGTGFFNLMCLNQEGEIVSLVAPQL